MKNEKKGTSLEYVIPDDDIDSYYKILPKDL